MCGLIGFITDKPNENNYKLFRNTMLQSGSRGKDATGLAIVTSEGKIIIDKIPKPVAEYITTDLPAFEEYIKKANIVIGHVRYATQGKPEDNNNNHPVESQNWIMIHNGQVHSLPKIEGYPYKGEVDSEVLLSYIETKGLEEGLLMSKHGSVATALLNKTTPNILYLFQHSGNIYLSYDEATSTIFFASAQSILEGSLRNKLLLFSTFVQYASLPQNELFSISHSPLRVEKLKELDIQHIYTYTYTPQQYSKINESNYDYLASKYTRYDNLITTPIVQGRTPSPITTQPTKDAPDDWGMEWVQEMGAWADPGIFNEDKEEKSKEYRFGTRSNDFLNWRKLNKGYASIDNKLYKYFDREMMEHVILPIEKAISDRLITQIEGVTKTIRTVCKVGCIMQNESPIIFYLESCTKFPNYIPSSVNIEGTTTYLVDDTECEITYTEKEQQSEILFWSILSVTELIDILAEDTPQDPTDRAPECKSYVPAIIGKDKFLSCEYCRNLLNCTENPIILSEID